MDESKELHSGTYTQHGDGDGPQPGEILNEIEIIVVHEKGSREYHPLDTIEMSRGQFPVMDDPWAGATMGDAAHDGEDELRKGKGIRSGVHINDEDHTFESLLCFTLHTLHTLHLIPGNFSIPFSFSISVTTSIPHPIPVPFLPLIPIRVPFLHRFLVFFLEVSIQDGHDPGVQSC